MKNSERYLQQAIAEELNQTNKMVFISGPRQVGKTTLARAFQILVEPLPERVGSPLSVNALREDIGKAYATVRSWYTVVRLQQQKAPLEPFVPSGVICGIHGTKDPARGLSFPDRGSVTSVSAIQALLSRVYCSLSCRTMVFYTRYNR